MPGLARLRLGHRTPKVRQVGSKGASQTATTSPTPSPAVSLGASLIFTVAGHSMYSRHLAPIWLNGRLMERLHCASLASSRDVPRVVAENLPE